MRACKETKGEEWDGWEWSDYERICLWGYDTERDGDQARRSEGVSGRKGRRTKYYSTVS